jgi:hypothetical protein
VPLLPDNACTKQTFDLVSLVFFFFLSPCQSSRPAHNFFKPALRLLFPFDLVLVFLLVFILFKIIYEIKILFQFHPHLIFSFIKLGLQSFNSYLCNLK